MFKRMWNWVRSFFVPPSKAELQAESVFLPSRKLPKHRESFMQKQARLRRERREARIAYFKKEAKRKAIPTVKQNCICGCGAEMYVKQGSLQFFLNRSHRHARRQRYGAIDYAKLK